jgi:uncharacterized protein YfkK (UPF0435 family)
MEITSLLLPLLFGYLLNNVACSSSQNLKSVDLKQVLKNINNIVDKFQGDRTELIDLHNYIIDIHKYITSENKTPDLIEEELLLVSKEALLIIYEGLTSELPYFVSAMSKDYFFKMNAYAFLNKWEGLKSFKTSQLVEDVFSFIDQVSRILMIYMNFKELFESTKRNDLSDTYRLVNNKELSSFAFEYFFAKILGKKDVKFLAFYWSLKRMKMLSVDEGEETKQFTNYVNQFLKINHDKIIPITVYIYEEAIKGVLSRQSAILGAKKENPQDAGKRILPKSYIMLESHLKLLINEYNRLDAKYQDLLSEITRFFEFLKFVGKNQDEPEEHAITKFFKDLFSIETAEKLTFTVEEVHLKVNVLMSRPRMDFAVWLNMCPSDHKILFMALYPSTSLNGLTCENIKTFMIQPQNLPKEELAIIVDLAMKGAVKCIAVSELLSRKSFEKTMANLEKLKRTIWDQKNDLLGPSIRETILETDIF